MTEILTPLRKLYYQAGYACLYKLMQRFPIVMPQRAGIPVRFAGNADLYIGSAVFFLREYDDALEDCARGASGRTIRFLDLGANVGYFTLRLADYAKQYNSDVEGALVEASPACIHELHRRLADIPELRNIRVHQGLAGKRHGQATMHVWSQQTNGMSSLFRPGDGGGIPVRYIDLETLTPTGTIDLIKCDIEGAEEQFLENYPELLLRTRMFVVELHHELCDTRRCEDLIAAAGLEDKRVLRHNGPAETVAVYTRR